MGQEPRTHGLAIRALTRVAVTAVLLAVAMQAAGQVRLVADSRGAREAPSPPPYEDRIIEGLGSGQADETREEAAYDRDGWPRFLRLETRLGTQPNGGQRQSVGLNASGVLDTPNHGTLSIDANLAPSEGRSAVTVRQRGLPMDGGWTVNNEIGVITPLAPGIMRLASRVFVPSFVTLGAGTEWLHAQSQTVMMASSGEPGRLQGYPVSGFEAFAGNITSLGGQSGFGDWSVAARHSRADGITRIDVPTRPSDYIDSDSTNVAVREASGNHSVQANFVETRTSEVAGARRGVWVDGEWKPSSSTYGWGFYRLDPDLSWSGQTMAADIEGAYARGSWRTRQWSADSSVDVLRSVSKPESTGILVTATGRWRYSQTLSLGAGGSARRYNGSAGSGFADMRWQNDLGSTGIRAEFNDGSGANTQRLTLDHTWLLPVGSSLATSLSGGRESGAASSGSLWGASVSFSVPVMSDATFTGNATTERQAGGTQYTSSNLSLVWRLSTRWALEGNYVYSIGRQRETLPVDPLAPGPERLTTTTGTRSLFLLLRYEDSAGSRTVPLGGPSQGGGGRIEGVVFLDGNRNGKQEAGELGAAGVTVFLDGRYAVRTDSHGRFEFPFVAAGNRTLTVLNETLPLPWVAGEQGETRIEIRVRETASVVIPVVRRGAD
jgi:hypothetical protein